MQKEDKPEKTDRQIERQGQRNRKRQTNKHFVGQTDKQTDS